MTLERVVLTETVQARGMTYERERETLQLVKPGPRVLYGQTVREMLGELRRMVAEKMPTQGELIAYIEQLQVAPLELETFVASKEPD